MYTFWGVTGQPYPDFQGHMETSQTYVRYAGFDYSVGLRG
jgi:hypothetical protein